MVLEILPVHKKIDENNINDTTSCVSSQETETGKVPVKSEIGRSPEQGGATNTNFLTKESYLGPTNLNNEKEEEYQINDIIRIDVEGTKENPVPWPAQSKILNDYYTSALGHMAIPTVFPHENNDWIIQKRRVEVSLMEYNMQTLKYSAKVLILKRQTSI